MAALTLSDPSRRERFSRRMRLEAVALAAGGNAAAMLAAIGVLWATQSWPAAIATGIVSVLISAAVADRMVRKHFRVIDRLADVARAVRGGGSLLPFDVTRFGAMAPVAEQYNDVFSALGEATVPVVDRMKAAGEIPGHILTVLDDIGESAEEQEGAVEEVASLMANINRSIEKINERVIDLSQSASESASSILELGGSVDAVAQNAGSLTEAVETCASAVQEMGASIRQVAESANSVQGMAEDTAASMTEMDRTVGEVSRHVQEASTLTERVSSGAEDGSQAVAATIEDIRLIDGLTRDARDVMGRLAERIEEISNILEVMGDINDETSLLSLNAAIIAAQAGEQGKAFLVVANHVKTLSERTAASTKDIEGLIKAVQSESANAVTAMGAGIDAIAQGVGRSRAAGEALDAIRSSADAASSRVSEIARATTEQAHNSQGVARAAQATSTQVQQISGALSEQLHASDQMLSSTETALEVCKQVQHSTAEQRETARYITASIASITEMIHEIQQSTAAHAHSSNAVSGAAQHLLANANASGEKLPELREMLETLRSTGGEIIRELSRFENAARTL